jgi:hypothetical protein
MSTSWLWTALLLFLAVSVLSAPLRWLLRLGRPPRGRAFLGHGDLRVLLSLLLWLALGFILYRATRRHPPAPAHAPPVAASVPSPQPCPAQLPGARLPAGGGRAPAIPSPAADSCNFHSPQPRWRGGVQRRIVGAAARPRFRAEPFPVSHRPRP